MTKDNSRKYYMKSNNRASIMSFTIKGISSNIATILDDDGVAIRAGHHCCHLHDKLGISVSARSFYWSL